MKVSARVQAGLLHLFQPGYSQNNTFTSLTPERALWMLAYLAVHDRWVSRDEIARLLWPDAEPEAARAALRQLLYRTKTLGLAPDLEVERTQLRWHEGSDLHDFLRAYQARDWEAVIATYQGELLSGFDSFEAEEFSAWLEIERRHLNSLWREAAQNQAAIHRQGGRYEEAATLLEGILRSDPLAEDVLCEYLQLALESGRHDPAMASYQVFAKQLDAELGLEPRAETQQLLEQLRGAGVKKPSAKTSTTAETPAVSRLPLPATQFVGRRSELEWLDDKLNLPGARVLSLVGPGGIGKTHLALEAAWRFSGPALFVSLVGQEAGQSLAPAVATAMGLSLPGQGDPETELLKLLEGQSLLVVLDNVEQVIEDARLLASRLGELEGVRLLFTSRVRLGLAGEQALELGGLSFPQRGEAINSADSYDAVRLLLETVWRVNPQSKLTQADQAEAVRICRSVQGVPLALVLAGSWARMLTLGEIAGELAKNLDFLEGAVQGLPQRHRGMRAVFEYSWRLLSAPQQQSLAALSVFRGGFERSAALAVTGASNLVLLELLDSSLLGRTQGETNRFDLHELIRQYAQEKLEANPQKVVDVQQKHAGWFLNWVEGIRLRRQKGLELAQWIGRIEQEHDNLRAVLGWAEREGHPETTIRLGSALMPFWRSRGYASEGQGWISRALERLGNLSGTSLHADALSQMGDLSWYKGDMTAAGVAYQRAVEVARAANHPASLAWALNGLGIAALYNQDYPLARQHFSELSVLTRQLGDKTLAATALNNLGCVLEYEGDYQGALRIHQESLIIRTEIGDAYGQSLSLFNLGIQARYLSDHPAAQQYYEQSLEISTALEDRHMMLDALNGLSTLAFQQADYSGARALYRQALYLSPTVQYRGLIADLLEGVAALLGVSGRGKTAARLLGHADALRKAAQIPVSPSELSTYQTQLESIKTAVGEIGFSLAWREGQTMALEQALRVALEALESSAVG